VTGLLVVCDPPLNRLSVFNPDGQLVRHVRNYGSFEVQDPRGLAFSPDGQTLYVTDAGYSVCFILDAQYQLAGAFGNPGALAGQFLEPTGVAMLGDRVLVADAQRGDIQAFTPLGVYLRLVARPGAADGEFGGPTFMLPANTVGLLVADTGNGRVQGLAADYAFEALLQLDIADGGPLLAPTGLAQDFRGQVYISDTGNHRVVVFDESGKFGFHFGAHGSRIIEFSPSTGPAGMVLDRSTGYLYVCDPGNHRIAVFKS
jgi:tripartite motif-containing protein 71